MLSPGTLVFLATRPWELGDVATWVGAGANVATLVLASIAAAVSYRIYKVESDRDARAEQDRRDRTADERRSQASLVSAWYSTGKGSEVLLGNRSIIGPGAWILNASDSPIYDAVLRYYRKNREEETWTRKAIRVVPPHQGALHLPFGTEDEHPLSPQAYRNTFEVTLQFRDAVGRYWQRDRRGYLCELPSQPKSTPGS